MSEKFCPYCGKGAKKDDQFCIYCGKPFISKLTDNLDGSKEKKSNIIYPSKKEETEKDDKKEKFVPFTSSSVPDEDIPDEDDDEDKKDKKKKGSVPFSDEDDIDEELDAVLSLDDNIKDQFEAKMDIAVLGLKKEKLKGILKDIMKEVKSEKYEYDMDFAKEINIKLNAIKEVQKQVKEKEDSLKDKIGIFRYDELELTIDEKRAQLTELKRKFKLKKIASNIFEQLKREYAAEYRKAQQDLEEMQKQVRIWISKLKSEKNREEIKLKMVKARHSAKEIDTEKMEQENIEYTKKIEIISQKIDVLKNYTGSSKKKI